MPSFKVRMVLQGAMPEELGEVFGLQQEILVFKPSSPRRTSEILGKSSWNTTSIDVNHYASLVMLDFMLS